MTHDEMVDHRQWLESIAGQLDRLVEEASSGRNMISAESDPRLAAGMSRLAKEVSEAATVARTLAIATTQAGR